ncbi:cupin domain-containing protein [Sinomonas flava]|uniref:Cupin domain-containing protein n=1 Tax=Sinomonas flava TaxID=496857 RepID=A0ABN3C3B2_9MICC
MSTHAVNAVTTLNVKSHDDPDEKRRPDKSEIDLVTVGDYTIGRFTFSPGWSWSGCIKPVVGTDSCQNNHVGYCVAGTLEVQLTSGETATITAGSSYTIPPGHDARVVGDETFVGLEFVSAATFAKPE